MVNTTQEIDCLQSVVKNISGAKMRFDFLPPHGRELDANEQMSFDGDLVSAVKRYTHGASQRRIDALKRAVGGDADNDREPTLEIISTPSPILQDTTNPANTFRLRVAGGSLGVLTPCWESDSSA